MDLNKLKKKINDLKYLNDRKLLNTPENATVSEWLPELEQCADISKYVEYEERLYSIFKQDFIDSKPTYDGKIVNHKFFPSENGKAEAFYHIISKTDPDGENRSPDFKRCERIRWVRKFIENYDCNMRNCTSCSGIKVWEEMYHHKKRIHILMEDERYIVVLEKRDGYMLLITAYYIEYEHTLKSKLNKYRQAKSALS